MRLSPAISRRAPTRRVGSHMPFATVASSPPWNEPRRRASDSASRTDRPRFAPHPSEPTSGRAVRPVPSPGGSADRAIPPVPLSHDRSRFRHDRSGPHGREPRHRAPRTADATSGQGGDCIFHAARRRRKEAPAHAPPLERRSGDDRIRQTSDRIRIAASSGCVLGYRRTYRAGRTCRRHGSKAVDGRSAEAGRVISVRPTQYGRDRMDDEQRDRQVSGTLGQSASVSHRVRADRDGPAHSP